MSDPILFEITDGRFGLSLVDPDAEGYLPTWQSPVGDIGSGDVVLGDLDPIEAVIADYEAASATWTCQVSQMSITARPSTSTETVRATLCAPGRQVPTPEQSQYGLNLRWYQDPQLAHSLSRWLFHFDTELAYVYLGFDGDDPPKAVGVIRVAPGEIGGDPRSPLEASLSLQFDRRPLYQHDTVEIEP